MNQVDPLVSVCIPTYNRAKALSRAVDALLACSYKNLEIIVSDNASPDETEIVGNAYSAADSRVRYFRHARNMGPTANFQFAREQAGGKYFLWHGDDDFLGADYIRTCVNELEQDPSLLLASGVAEYFDGDGAFTHYGNIIQPASYLPLLRVLKYLWLVDDNSIFCGAYRREQLSDCRMPNKLAGDWGWMAQVLTRGKARVIPAIHVHRKHGDTLSASYERIVAVIGAPRWHARFASIACAMNVANHLIGQSQEYRRKTLPGRMFDYAVVFLVLLAKGLKHNLRILATKIPFARKIYRKYFKKQA